MHHLNWRTVPTSYLRLQVFPKDRHLFAIRRANMRGKVSLSPVWTALRSKQEQVGKLAGCQPWKPAAVIQAPECQASVTLEAVPAQVGSLQSFAAHGLHRIPEDRLHVSDFCEHAGPTLTWGGRGSGVEGRSQMADCRFEISHCKSPILQI